jgi:hypothetical protein
MHSMSTTSSTIVRISFIFIANTTHTNELLSILNFTDDVSQVLSHAMFERGILSDNNL